MYDFRRYVERKVKRTKKDPGSAVLGSAEVLPRGPARPCEGPHRSRPDFESLNRGSDAAVPIDPRHHGVCLGGFRAPGWTRSKPDPWFITQCDENGAIHAPGRIECSLNQISI